MPDRLAAFIRFFLLCLLVSILHAAFLHAAELRGKVVSVAGGEPLGRVQVAVLDAQGRAVAASNTKDDGSFVISGVDSGHYTLRVNAVGYRLVTVDFSLAIDEVAKEFEISVAPDNFRRTEKVEVKGDIFQGADSPAVVEENLTASELRETSTVIGDDPFRAIQTLPGVSASSNNDFFAQFAVMGASYENTSTYIDGILVPNPFHGINVSEGATLSVLTSEAIEEIKLLPAAYPEKYGDAVGAALDLHTREGSRTGPIYRASFGLAESELLGEGRLGHARRGSWLASVRKSYVGYLLRNRLNDAYDDVSFYDGSVRLDYDIVPNQTLSFSGLGGHTKVDQLHLNNPDLNGFKSGTNDFGLGRLGWRWTVNPGLLVEAHFAYVDAPFKIWDPIHVLLNNNHHDEWSGGGSLEWSWRKDDVLDLGWMTRRVKDAEVDIFFDQNNQPFTSSRSATGWKHDGYVQQNVALLNNRLHLIGGVRLDTAEQFNVHPVSPQLSAAFKIAESTQLQFGVGRYNQFSIPANPLELLPLFNQCIPGSEFLQTANHYTAGLEQRLGESTRLKVTLFDRQNASLYAENQVSRCTILPHYPPPHNFVAYNRDYSRGAQIVLQSRSATRLSGWIGYTLTYARQSSPLTIGGVTNWVLYPTLQDQRHTLNVFASYRLTPSVHLSGKFLYGSGFPIPGTNQYVFGRLGDYQRLDTRVEKDWVLARWKLALYGELLNTTNHYNPRYFYTTVNQGGTYSVVTGRGLPILPTAGVACEF